MKKGVEEFLLPMSSWIDIGRECDHQSIDSIRFGRKTLGPSRCGKRHLSLREFSIYSSLDILLELTQSCFTIGIQYSWRISCLYVFTTTRRRVTTTSWPTFVISSISLLS